MQARFFFPHYIVSIRFIRFREAKMTDTRFQELDNEKVRYQMKKLVAAFLGAAEESILAERAAAYEKSKPQPSHTKSTAHPHGSTP